MTRDTDALIGGEEEEQHFVIGGIHTSELFTFSFAGQYLVESKEKN